MEKVYKDSEGNWQVDDGVHWTGEDSHTYWTKYEGEEKIIGHTDCWCHDRQRKNTTRR